MADAISGGSRGRMRGMHPPTGTHSAPKLAILRSKIENNFWGGLCPLPRPLPRGEGYPSPPPHGPASTTSPSTNDFWIRHCVRVYKLYTVNP